MRKILKCILLVAAITLAFSFNNAAYAETVSKSDFNSILLNKGYTEYEIAKMSDRVKEKLASSSGEKANYAVEMTEYYNSPEGKRIEVTNENKKFIREKMREDAIKYSKKHDISVMDIPTPIEVDSANVQSTNEGISTYGVGDSHVDNKLLFSVWIQKYALSSTSVWYTTELDFQWGGFPSFTFTDSIALAWDNKFTGDASSLQKYFYLSLDNSKPLHSAMSTSQSIYGYSGKFQAYPSLMWGGLSQEVTAPKSQIGNPGKFQAKYVHSFMPFSGSVSLGPASVDVPATWTSQEFELNLNIGIGN